MAHPTKVRELEKTEYFLKTFTPRFVSYCAWVSKKNAPARVALFLPGLLYLALNTSVLVALLAPLGAICVGLSLLLLPFSMKQAGELLTAGLLYIFSAPLEFCLGIYALSKAVFSKQAPNTQSTPPSSKEGASKTDTALPTSGHGTPFTPGGAAATRTRTRTTTAPVSSSHPRTAPRGGL